MDIIKSISAAAMVAVILSAPVASHADCKTAEKLYNDAMASTDNARRLPLLERAARECDSFEVSLALGGGYAELGELDKAEVSLRKACSFADTKEKTALAYQSLGMVYKGMGRDSEASISLKRSLMAKRDTQTERALFDITKKSAGKVMTAHDITQRIKNSRSLGVEADCDLRVNFEFNSDKLTDEGIEQADEIGKAMTGADMKGEPVKLVGHTDLSGDDDYNDKLSLRRAQSVRNYIVSKFDINPLLITVEGMGKREPLFLEGGEEAEAMNRRVELVVGN